MLSAQIVSVSKLLFRLISEPPVILDIMSRPDQDPMSAESDLGSEQVSQNCIVRLVILYRVF